MKEQSSNIVAFAFHVTFFTIIESYIALHPLVRGRTPPRDIEAELREELDCFVVAVLTEYAKLFLEPKAAKVSGSTRRRTFRTCLINVRHGLADGG